MKIAIVCLNLKWQAGGTRLIYSLARKLGEAGHTVVIYAPEVNPNAFPDLREGLTIRVVKPAYDFTWGKKVHGLWRRIANKILQEYLQTDTSKRIAKAMDADFDMVNVHDFAYKVAFYFKKRNPGTRIIWTENDPPYMYLPKKSWLYDVLSQAFHAVKDLTERAYFKSIDTVAVLDSYNKQWCEKRGLKPVVVRSGVDFENFYHHARRRTSIGEQFTIFSLGALNPYRRFEDIVRASVILKKKGYDVHANIICKDIWSEPDYKKTLSDLVQELDATSYVNLNFVGVSNEELREAFNSAHAFVLSTYLPLPRNGYGWGLTNFEAMAAGLPLVICRTSTATEVLTDGENALFVDPQSPESIAKKIEFLITHPLEYNTIAARGQSFVKENISWEKYASEMLELLKYKPY